MAEIVAFPTRDDGHVVWRCGCGCVTHFARADGNLECASCFVIATGETGEWRTRLPDTPASPKPQDEADIKVTDLMDAEPMVKRMLRDLDTDDLKAIICILGNGRIRGGAWDCTTDEQRDWLKRRFDDAFEMVMKGQR